VAFSYRRLSDAGWDAPKGQEKVLLGNFYACGMRCLVVAEYAADHMPELEHRTRDFVNALEHQRSRGSQEARVHLCTLVSNTSFRIGDGSFMVLRMRDRGGLGLWHLLSRVEHEVATQFLFPTLARSCARQLWIRDRCRGTWIFATTSVGEEHWGLQRRMADGQIVSHFDWVLSGDNDCCANNGRRRSEPGYALGPGGLG